MIFQYRKYKLFHRYYICKSHCSQYLYWIHIFVITEILIETSWGVLNEAAPPLYVYTRHLERLVSVHRIVYFYNVHIPTPWTLRNIIGGGLYLENCIFGDMDFSHVVLLRLMVSSIPLSVPSQDFRFQTGSDVAWRC